MKATLASMLTLALLLSSATVPFFASLATANSVELVHLPKITILSSGDISQNSNCIQRNGSVYTLVANDTENTVEIHRSNMIFDGEGRAIDLRKPEDGSTLYSGIGLRLMNVHNVTIRNLTITGTLAGAFSDISLWYCSNCSIIAVKTGSIAVEGDFNTITESSAIGSGILLSGSNNSVTRNDIRGLIVMGGSYNNSFFENNFSFKDYPDITSDAFWDDGSVGNYWSNYTVRYPNASEIGNSGIGNTPYVIETGSWTAYCNYENKSVDYHPLMYPWGTPEVAVLGLDNANYSLRYPLNFTVNKPTQWMGYSLDGEVNVTVTGNTTLTGLAIGAHNVTVYATDVYGVGGVSKTVNFTVTEPFPAVLVVGVCAVAVAGVSACFLYYRKRKSAC
jgi:hypothetical protein